MLWIALYIPELSLQIAARALQRERAIVIKDGAIQRPIVSAANRSARALGIQPGIPVAAAEAIASHLIVIARNKDNEVQALERLAAWLLQFTPTVSLQETQGVLLEVEASLRMQGGFSALLEKITAGCRQLGYFVIHSAAPTARAAWWFALAGRKGCQIIAQDLRMQLSRLDIAALCWPVQTVERLRALGIQRLADLLALPRAGLTQRFGADLVYQVDQALGIQADVRAVFSPPAQFRSRIELPAEANEVNALLFPLKRLLLEMEGMLRGLGAGVQSVRVELAQGRQTEAFDVGLLAPERDHQRLLNLIAARLMHLQLQRSVWAVSLFAEEIHPLSSKQQSLIADKASQQIAGRELLERLHARLGKQKIQTLSYNDDHRPERAWRTGESECGKFVDVFPLRPLWLLPRPYRVVSRDFSLLAGPERIEAGWWDNEAIQRDYYVARNGKGAVLWVYRPHSEPLQWYLHGVFA